MADNKMVHRNQGGRPPKAIAEKRTAEVKFHVTPDMKRRLQNEAIIAGTDLATYCREKVLTGQPPRRIPPEILAAVAELMRQGNNLNQAVRNNYYGLNTEREIKSCIADLKELYRKISVAAGGA